MIQRMTGSLRALDVYPCGGCRALVAREQGCIHTTAKVIPKVACYAGSRRLLSAALADERGRVDCRGDVAAGRVARHLAAAGLLVRGQGLYAVYALTDWGREVATLLESSTKNQEGTK